MSDVGSAQRLLYDFTMARSKLRRFVVVAASSALIAGLFAYAIQTPATAAVPATHTVSESLPHSHDGCADDGADLSVANCLALCAIAYAIPAVVSMLPVLGREACPVSVAKTLEGRGDPPDPPPPR